MRHLARAVLFVCCSQQPLAAMAETDALCAPLKAFAASVRPKQEQEIAFHTMWGGSFKDDPSGQSIWQSRCIHHDYEPARAVCGYLLKNASIEFPGINLKRSLQCLSPGTRLGRHVRLDRGAFTLDEGDSEHGSRIVMTLDEDSTIGGMVLRIEVRGYLP